jgi:hypothetical protein
MTPFSGRDDSIAWGYGGFFLLLENGRSMDLMKPEFEFQMVD